MVAIAEAQLVGAECFDDIEDVRADHAGAALRAVAQTPSAPTARQLARRLEPSHIRAVERAAGRCGNELDARLGRDPGEDVTLDLDPTESKVYGRKKRGTGRSRHGHLAYNSYLVTWAQRGRGLTSELKRGNQARIKAAESERMLGRAERLLPAEHGQITVRGDSGFYAVELMMDCRKRGMRFTLSAIRTSLMGSKLHEITEDAWEDTIDMHDAQVAELPFTPEGWKHERLRLIARRVPVSAAEIQASSPRARRRNTIPPEQPQMVPDGELSSTYAYSFILTDIPQDEMTAVEVEHFHRQRAQIEERFKDLKLGQALRHLPSADLAANRLWLACALLALNITAWVCDISPAAGASGNAADQHTPLRRHAKALRRILFCVPGPIVRTARRIIIRLPAGFPHFETCNATYHAALALPGPNPPARTPRRPAPATPPSSATPQTRPSTPATPPPRC